LTLSGTASRGQRVEIFDGYGGGAASHGIATANTTTGEWQHPISVIQGGRRLYAKSLYHSTTEYSNVRTLTVVPVEAPTLTSVKGSPSGEDIPDGGNTVETAVILSGTASKGQNVKVFDGATSKGQATADKSTGVWTLPVSGLSAAAHSFTAKALYGPGATSEAWKFTVIDNIEDFETSPALYIGTVGQSVDIKLGRVTLLSKSHEHQGLGISRQQFPQEHIRGMYLYCNIAYYDMTMSFSFQLINGTANRITFWIRNSAIYAKDPRMVVSFLNSSGQLLRTITVTTPAQSDSPEQQVDSGVLSGIKTIRFTAYTHFDLDYFKME